MRRVLALLGARGTVALGLAVLVLAVLGIARLVGSRADGVPGLRPGDAGVFHTVDATTGDDGLQGPQPTATRDDPAIRQAASRFIAAWLRSNLSATAWHAGIAPLATATLAKSLHGVDPAAVPAARVAGPATLIIHSAGYAEVAIPVDTGTVRLRLLERQGRWLVDGIDWGRQ